MQILLIKHLIPSQDISFDFVRNFEKNQIFLQLVVRLNLSDFDIHCPRQ